MTEQLTGGGVGKKFLGEMRLMMGEEMIIGVSEM